MTLGRITAVLAAWLALGLLTGYRVYHDAPLLREIRAELLECREQVRDCAARPLPERIRRGERVQERPETWYR